MKIIFSIFLFSISISMMGQFSVYGKYHANTTEYQTDWERLVQDSPIMKNSQFLGVSYWLRLKNYRVEFHPGIYYFTSDTDLNLGDVNVNFSADKFNMSGFGFEVPIHFYFMDFEGDCNCPTFSKQGNFFSKGIFAFLSPGIRNTKYQFQNLSVTNAELALDENTDTRLTLGFGLGIDFGITDLITLTPFAGLELSPSNSWSAMNSIIALEDGGIIEDRNLRSITVGLRLSIRPD